MTNFNQFIPLIRKMLPHLVGGPLELIPVNWTDEELALIKRLRAENEPYQILDSE